MGCGLFSKRYLISLALALAIWLLPRSQVSADYVLARTIGGTGQLNNPSGITVDSAGNVYVADSVNNRIDEYTNTGALVQQINGITATSSANALFDPQGVAVDAAGNIWVADSLNFRIEEFSSNGDFLQKIGGSPPLILENPAALAFDSSGNVWVADSAQGQVLEFSSSGTFMKKISDFGNPRGIAFDPAGNIWLANPNSGTFVHVQEFTTSGTQLSALGPFILSLSDKDVSPDGLTFDSHGNLWVADTLRDRVIEFDPNGNTLQKFGFGGTVGSFGPPVGVAVDSADNVWVIDQARNQIDEFSPVPEPAAGLTAAIAAIALTLIYQKPMMTCQFPLQRNSPRYL